VQAPLFGELAMGEAQQAAEAQLGEARIQGRNDGVEFRQHFIFGRLPAAAVEQRLQRGPDARIAIHQHFVAIDQ
jgi:hypothetical protein